MNGQPSEAEDPIDLLTRRVPRHLWVTITIVAVMLLASWLFFKPPVPVAGVEVEVATNETVEGRVVEVLAEEEIVVAGEVQPVQRVLVEITSGSQSGNRVEVLHGQASMLTDGNRVAPGDRILLQHDVSAGAERFDITDFVRSPALLGLTLLFSVAAVAVGGWVGFRALISMGISVLTIIAFIIPAQHGHRPRPHRIDDQHPSVGLCRRITPALLAPGKPDCRTYGAKARSGTAILRISDAGWPWKTTRSRVSNEHSH